MKQWLLKRSRFESQTPFSSSIAVSVADEVSIVAANLTEAIKGNMHKDLSKLKMEDLERLASIFQEAASKIAEQDARQPRVPRRREVTPPRVQASGSRELNRDTASAPRVDLDCDEHNPPALLQEDGTECDAREDGPRYMTRQQKRLCGSMLHKHGCHADGNADDATKNATKTVSDEEVST